MGPALGYIVKQTASVLPFVRLLLLLCPYSPPSLLPDAPYSTSTPLPSARAGLTCLPSLPWSQLHILKGFHPELNFFDILISCPIINHRTNNNTFPDWAAWAIILPLIYEELNPRQLLVYSDVAKGKLIPSWHQEAAQDLSLALTHPAESSQGPHRVSLASLTAGWEHRNEENSPIEKVVERERLWHRGLPIPRLQTQSVHWQLRALAGRPLAHASAHAQ